MRSSIIHFNAVKPTNEKIYYTIEALEKAIREKKKVRIRYFHLNHKHTKVYRSENGVHTVEPIALVYNNDKYYLTCYNPKAERNYNYRLDRIEKVEILDEKISKNAIIRSRSVAKYTAQVFKMYGGETVKVRKKIYQGRKMQECFHISSFSDAEKFSLRRVFYGKV